MFLSPLGQLLSNESVCELMQACFRMCFIDRANELLRKSAETALTDMIRLLFSRLHIFPTVESMKKSKASPAQAPHMVFDHSNVSSTTPSNSEVMNSEIVNRDTVGEKKEGDAGRGFEISASRPEEIVLKSDVVSDSLTELTTTPNQQLSPEKEAILPINGPLESSSDRQDPPAIQVEEPTPEKNVVHASKSEFKNSSGVPELNFYFV